MTERQRERQSIINTLVGPIESIGESNFDNKVLDNMDFVEDVISYFVDTLARNAEYRGEELNLSDAEKERCARENPLQFDSAKGYANGIANAIEIVEKGGIE